MVPTFYYLVALPVFGLLGIVVHLLRALFSALPFGSAAEGLLDAAILGDDPLTHGPGWFFDLFSTRHTDAGRYDLASLQNIRICCQVCIGLGMAALIFIPGLDQLFRSAVDFASVWLADLFLFRLKTLTLF